MKQYNGPVSLPIIESNAREDQGIYDSYTIMQTDYKPDPDTTLQACEAFAECGFIPNAAFNAELTNDRLILTLDTEGQYSVNSDGSIPNIFALRQMGSDSLPYGLHCIVFKYIETICIQQVSLSI